MEAIFSDRTALLLSSRTKERHSLSGIARVVDRISVRCHVRICQRR